MLTSSNTLKMAAGLLIGASFAPLAFAGSGYGAPSYTPDLVPSNPSAGMCYARVEIPAEYTTTTEDVLVEEGYTTIEVSNPKLASRQEKVLMKEASVRYEVRQPRFKTVSEKVMTRPAYDKLTVTPPSFSHVTETMASSAPRLVWKKGNPGNLMRQGYKIHSTADAGRNGQGYRSTTEWGQTGGATNCGPTCEIWCLVEEPGETVQYQRKIVSNPARVQRQSVPARYQTIMKQVVADPGGVREIPVPARYQTVMVEDIVQPGGERQVTVPPKYGKVEKKQLVSAERFEWRQVVCNTGTAPVLHQNMTSSATMVTPTQITSAPAYTMPQPTTSYSSGEMMAPTVNEMLANGARSVCIPGQDCSKVMQLHGNVTHGSNAYGGGQSVTYGSHAGGHTTGHTGGHAGGQTTTHYGGDIITNYESGRWGH